MEALMEYWAPRRRRLFEQTPEQSMAIDLKHFLEDMYSVQNYLELLKKFNGEELSICAKLLKTIFPKREDFMGHRLDLRNIVAHRQLLEISVHEEEPSCETMSHEPTNPKPLPVSTDGYFCYVLNKVAGLFGQSRKEGWLRAGYRL
jgi:hypothetical protein